MGGGGGGEAHKSTRVIVLYTTKLMCLSTYEVEENTIVFKSYVKYDAT